MRLIRPVQVLCLAATVSPFTACFAVGAGLQVAPGVTYEQSASIPESALVTGRSHRVCGFIFTPGSPNHRDLMAATERAAGELAPDLNFQLLSVQAKTVYFPLVSICSVYVVGVGVGEDGTIRGTDSTEETLREARTPDEGSASSGAVLRMGTYGDRFRRGYGLSLRDASIECDEGELAACAELGHLLEESADIELSEEGTAILEAVCRTESFGEGDEVPEPCLGRFGR